MLVGPGWACRATPTRTATLGELRHDRRSARFAPPATTCSPGTRAGSASRAGRSKSTRPHYEAPRRTALIDYVARQPEAQLDRRGDPRVGMSGGSYGGGIQLVTAATTRAWTRSRPTSRGTRSSRASTRRSRRRPAGATSCSGSGVGVARPPGPARGQTGNLDPHIASAYASGLATGQISDEDVQWFASRGPGAWSGRSTLPTLLIQGTADTLFTLDEAIRNYAILRKQPRADQDDLVLRRPRRVPHEQRSERASSRTRSSAGSRAT